jgi:hypothetical protein
MVAYGSPEYNARLKAAAKRIALDHILQELLIEVARSAASPVAWLNDLQARVHARFGVDADQSGNEVHVQAEAAHFADDYFEQARNGIQKT